MRLVRRKRERERKRLRNLIVLLARDQHSQLKSAAATVRRRRTLQMPSRRRRYSFERKTISTMMRKIKLCAHSGSVTRLSDPQDMQSPDTAALAVLPLSMTAPLHQLENRKHP